MSSDKYLYKSPFDYKLIYVFRINDTEHEGCLKIGDATINFDGSPDSLAPCCKELKDASNNRIRQYTNTAGVRYDLLYTELAFFKDNKGKYQTFRDNKVHTVLLNSGIKKKKIANAQEWFKTDLETAKKAISAVKEGRKSLYVSEISKDKTPIVFRPSQIEAIEKTVSRFKKKAHKQFLWNAKMRFGKTLAAYEVVRLLGYAKTLIYTHRPVVLKGWKEDFEKIFSNETTPWLFGNKRNQVNKSGVELQDLLKTGKNFVYFASLQDLRGSKTVGGSFDKNDDVFKTDWDLVIVDEAHEGTQTGLGNEVLSQIFTKDNKAKLLQLSGTPFNLITKFSEDEMYTWDYTMEQMAKALWYKEHGGDSNPYADLPAMQIYTFDLAKQFSSYVDSEKAFNFREFFRVWSGDILRDGRAVPNTSDVGKFVYEKDVKKFLNIITKAEDGSNFPFASEQFRAYFRHTLWMVPGVAAAKALSALLSEHPIFSKFNIANVAGDGDEEEDSKEALKKVEAAIGDDPDDSYSITLSCGRLTTGVSVKPWTAVMMLAGSYSTAASQYLQTIFRVQTPAEINGRSKEMCYVFDFAPDRTLKMMADAVNLSSKAGRSEERSKKAMGQLLNFCPIIAVDGTNMREYNVEQMLVQLKKAYIDKVSVNGFDDSHLYNFNLPELSDADREMFKHLHEIASSTGQSKKPQDLIINKQGLDEEEHEKATDDGTPKPKREKTKEELEKAEKKKERDSIISNLRAISIRIPLLVYGANIPFGKDITIDNLTDDDVVDDISWEEFMPKGFTKENFKYFRKFYDPEIFIGAGRQIRGRVKNAENLPVVERVQEIAEIFATFRNPDKETVLTPWRVVNMHMSDCLGGYDFWNETHTETLDTPRVVDHGKITAETFWNVNAKFLEINSKTGLYPLYVAYSLFSAKRQANHRKTDAELWEQTLKENVFVLCKTPMAEYITRRTLAGFKKLQVNAKYYPNLLKDAKENPNELTKTICNGMEFWKAGEKDMKFDAIVGNPPYQETLNSTNANAALAKQLFPYFIKFAIDVNPKYISLITPSRWFTADAQDHSFVKLREYFHEKKSNCFSCIYQYTKGKELFPSVEIGPINYFLLDMNKKDKKTSFVECSNGAKVVSYRPLFEDGLDIILSMNKFISIIEKLRNYPKFTSFMTITKGRNAFGVVGKESELKAITKNKTFSNAILVRCAHEEIRYIPKENVPKGHELIGKWKIFTSKGNGGAGVLNEEKAVAVIGKSYIGEPNSICTDSLIPIGCFNSESEAKNLATYMRTKFLRFLVGILKTSQNIYQNVYKYVPLENFSQKSDIDWSKPINEIDKQLYLKYELSSDEQSIIETMVKPME